jgi:carboxyl-terminal processing protease
LESSNISVRFTGLATVLLGLALLSPQLRASSPFLTDDIKARQFRAKQYEALGRWDKACDEYAAILRIDRGLTGVRESYQRCLRRYHLVFRHRDFSYNKEVLGLKYSQALRLCELVLTNLMDNAVERQRVQPGRLTRYGAEELTFALDEPEFRQEYLPNVKAEALAAFRAVLREAFESAGQVRNRRDVLDQVRHLALKGQTLLGLNAVVTVMEYTCGACAAVDEYTLFLSPGQLREWVDVCKGNYVGVGLKLRREDGRLIVGDVVPGSPAAEATFEFNGMKLAALAPGDQVVTIGKRGTAEMTPEAAQDLLEGEAGTTVDVIVSPPMGEPRHVTLRRRPLFVPSINFNRLEVKDGVGYLPISCFQETTLQELDDAILALNKAGMRTLVLDLRGNGGGMFDVAVEVARRFLASGIIVSTQHADPRLNTTYHARNLDAWGMPVVVLVDGSTASSAEVLAGALKDNRRARLVGQTTFGKGYSQILVRLSAANGTLAGGVRLTVAKFFSPLGHPYAGRGILPHVFAIPADEGDSMSRADPPLDLARIEAQKLLDPQR